MKEYSFLNVTLIVNGVAMDGFDEGDDVISLARTNDSAAHKVGVDGDMTISISADRSGSCTFRMMQSSNANTYLSGLVAAQENGAFAPILLLMKDVKGGSMGVGSKGYITKPADMVRGQNANAQEWVIVVENLSLLH